MSFASREDEYSLSLPLPRRTLFASTSMSAQNRQVVSLTHAKEPRRTKREATGTGQKYFITMKASLQPSQVSSSHPFISPPPSRCLCIPVSPCLYTPRLPTRRIHHLVLFVDFLSTSPLPPLSSSFFVPSTRPCRLLCVCVCVCARVLSLSVLHCKSAWRYSCVFTGQQCARVF